MAQLDSSPIRQKSPKSSNFSFRVQAARSWLCRDKMCKDKPDFSEGFMLYTTILTSTTRNPEPDSAKKCLPTLHQNQCLNSEVKSGQPKKSNRERAVECTRSGCTVTCTKKYEILRPKKNKWRNEKKSRRHELLHLQAQCTR